MRGGREGGGEIGDGFCGWSWRGRRALFSVLGGAAMGPGREKWGVIIAEGRVSGKCAMEGV